MAIENSANNVGQLEQNWPLKEDFVSEGDDHIRLLKRVLKSTFGKIKDVLTITDKQLNTLSHAVDDELSEKQLSLYGGKVVIKNTGEILTEGGEVNENTLITLKFLMDKVYPVGSLYTTTNSTNPASTLGFGTWEAFAQGRALTGVGSAEGRNITGGATGGSWTKALGEGNVPAHAHKFSGKTAKDGKHKHVSKIWGSWDNGENSGGSPFLNGNQWAEGRDPKQFDVWTQEDADHEHAFSGVTASYGKGEAFDIAQPYIGAYIWKRIK